MNPAKALMIATLPLLASLLTTNAIPQLAHADVGKRMDSDKARIVEYWTRQRIADAIPRDLAIDHRGLGYLRKPDGTLNPYGHQTGAEAAPQQVTPFARPPGAGGGGDDSTAPTITNMDPGSGVIIGASHTFSATVTDASGIKSVSFVIQYPDGTTTQSFSASNTANTDTWSITIQGFTDGGWSWWVIAKDNASKGGNTKTSQSISFSVSTAGSGGDSGSGSGNDGTDTIANAAWTAGGTVQTAAGRIYFEMPANPRRKGPWTGYVCSGTVIDDVTSNRSVILTAAHCVYDDANKAFARNVLFIPNQGNTSGSGTDLNCNNDPLGCWTPSFGVVDTNWTTATFPDNIPWDYAYYVVADSGSHAGPGSVAALDEAAGSLPISFLQPYVDDGVPGGTSIDFTHALGYSYSDDPVFMYCSEDMTTEGAYNWWLSSCGLSGGSSGGPWVQPMDTGLGTGPVISVNSWGYTTSPGMAGPKLSDSSASCLLTTATSRDWLSVSDTDGEAGVAAVCP